MSEKATPYLLSTYGMQSALHMSPPLIQMGFPRGSDGKECLQCRRWGFSPWVRRIPWRREWLPTLVSLSGEFHGQKSLVD